ncbi:MAG: TauD/TfdA family dioxygenase [Rhodospirillales bacterium]|jgi:taurine dioxygenase|nr:TauD/TfdA family dioxygenase [Rhodospirillaceae bacterium]MBT7770852.1 TauD/TfdA family dioxygenase [Rhodospirillales bacterium]MBT5034570.1 TauD/TfdA family dioxygenase [Rhodospirillaceae bacterium]MBT6221199.1 TauD/TfdA family dioxygenase [Rhodospirillaceae bacterium]MBT6364141.1 TauD/TfdA family dioxygenase [Rhodospirillaceae bacterium]
MNLQVTSHNGAVGATVSDIDLSQSLDAETVAELHQAWLNHIVLVFPDQQLSDPALMAFAKHFGDLEFPPSKLLNYTKGSGQKDDIPAEINVISNVIEDGKPIGQLGYGEALWHTDSAFVERPPSASILHALELPPRGGNTSFMNMYAVLEALPTHITSRLEGRRCKHDASHTSDGALRHDFAETADASLTPGPSHPMIRTHPETGRKALYLGRRLNAYIEGMSLEESEELLDEIWQIVEATDGVYEHVWSLGDVVMWDNRCAMHRRAEFNANERRIMHRSQVQGSVPV